MSENGYADQSFDGEDNVEQLQESDTLIDRGVEDVLDEGYIAPDHWSPAQGYGNTPREEAEGESLDQRLRQEEPEPDPYAEAAQLEDVENIDDGEVGDTRAGRLVDPDRGIGEDTEKDLVGDDVGIDGAGASAEEAAMHIIEE